jgi:hypothetical protein
MLAVDDDRHSRRWSECAVGVVDGTACTTISSQNSYQRAVRHATPPSQWHAVASRVDEGRCCGLLRVLLAMIILDFLDRSYRLLAKAERGEIPES